MSFEQLPVELIHEITKEVNGAELSNLQATCRYARTCLLDRQWEHIVLERDKEEVLNPEDDDTYWREINQFHEETEFPSLDLCAARFIRITPSRHHQFIRWWQDNKLAFLPDLVNRVSIKCSGDNTADKDRDKENWRFITDNILAALAATVGTVELHGSSSNSPIASINFPNAAIYLTHIPVGFDSVAPDLVTKCTGLRLVLERGSSRDLITQVLPAEEEKRVPARTTYFAVEFGHQHLPREGGDPQHALTSAFMRELLSNCWDNLRVLKIYWQVGRGVDYDWIPPQIEHLLLMDSQPASMGRRANTTVELANLHTLELESKYGRALRRILTPNLQTLALKSPRRLGQLENQVDAVQTLRSASLELELECLDMHSLSYGAIMQFSSPSIRVLALRNIMGGTTAFTDMTQTMEDFLLTMSKLYPNLETMYVEIDNPIASDQLRSILGYFVRRKPRLSLFFGFDSAQLASRIIGRTLLDGAMEKWPAFIHTTVHCINTTHDNVYRFKPESFY